MTLADRAADLPDLSLSVLSVAVAPGEAAVGDRIAVPGRTTGASRRTGTVVEVRGAAGGPPYVVEWDDGTVAVCYPGPATEVTRT